MSVTTDSLLNELDRIIDEGKAVPLSNKILIDGESVKRIIEDLRLNMPKEITQAKKIANERHDILSTASEEADAVVAKARERADLMIEEHQITKEAREGALLIMQKAEADAKETVANAKAHAREVVDSAERWSNDLRTSASSYVEKIIKATDETLTQSVTDVRSLRNSLKESLSHQKSEKPKFDD